MRDAAFTLADKDFFTPLAAADPGPRYRIASAPAGWRSAEFDVWTFWSPEGLALPEHGWKVHVSASLANSAKVLDVVAGVCTRLGVPFKHLSGHKFFLWLHGKHASRAQSGKFCALYPPTPELAHEVLAALDAALAGIDGPYVLTDRRFGESHCVSYRYGAFSAQPRLEHDGTSTPMVRGVDGRLVPDERRPEFHLPEGVTDPFTTALDELDDGEVSFHGYTFEAVLQHSNAGGAYRARTAGGRQVFIKEARAHNGYVWNGTDARRRLEAEYLTLRTLHEVAPGSCPEPVEFFTHWEHSYLVTELVPGTTLTKWTVANTPVIQTGQPPERYAAYYRRCLNVLNGLSGVLDRLHRNGYVFVDINPRNVLIDEDDRVRLIDFESAQPANRPINAPATPGYFPPEAADPDRQGSLAAEYYDDYGLSAVAQMLVFPLHQIADRSPDSLHHLFAELAEHGPVPDELRETVLRFQPPPTGALPTPEEVSQRPEPHLRDLRDATADALEAMAGQGKDTLFPTVPDGYLSNTRCVAYGTAGVLHALRVAGRVPDPRWVRSLRDESLAGAERLGPGLLFGNAGIAWVLADLGEREAADELLLAASAHPLLRRSATLGGGTAGLALAHLHRFATVGDHADLATAGRLLDELPEDLTPLLGKDNASGLVHGRPGVALALYYLSRFSGDPQPMRRGVELLREELDHRQPLEVDGLGFRVSDKDRRNMPYLFAGSAGFVHVLSRYLTVVRDDELATVLEGCLRSLGIRFTVSSGLFQGQAGMGLALSGAARLLDRPELADRALDSARALVKYAVPHATGVRWAGSHGQRLSAELWSGSAGVLLALHQVLEREPDPLFTLDALLPEDEAAPAATAAPETPGHPAGGKCENTNRRETP
ncbi:class III lanthionine synthetase LanKC [Amycolatopsis magusensis]|uniref:tRNA A-37 threonylcarbamoyl transferase component Bud32 n=1 Tax=Amycolatopsis magusensis TaxID=882444 RepID=A0ABS4PQV6_9PSEU|nr:class III lanthionine synthetase LanKC [Amycolatopsis magusensis]MBP2181807.1 tRNA A-37 threonylcarbamoyl transferase component Bud32 [Amycolatopsis magusensis]